MDKEEFNKKCVEVIESMGTTGKFEDIIKGKDIIHNFANHCRNTKFYNRDKDEDKHIDFIKKFDKYGEKEKIERLALEIVCKISDSPTSFHADGVMILLLPKLDNFITTFFNKVGSRSKQGDKRGK